MSLNTWRHQGPCKPSSCTTFMPNSHWGRAATGKKPCFYALRVVLVVSNSLHPCRLWPARLLCQGGRFSRQEYWSIYWQMLVTTYPFRALYFLLPWPPTPLSTWCCKNTCDPSSCTVSTPGPHRGKPKSSRAASGANPSG